MRGLRARAWRARRRSVSVQSTCCISSSALDPYASRPGDGLQSLHFCRFMQWHRPDRQPEHQPEREPNREPEREPNNEPHN